MIDSLPFVRIRPASDAALAAATLTPTESNLTIILVVLCSVTALVLIVSTIWFARKRAAVLRSVDDVLAALRKAVSNTGGNLKDLSEWDNQIKHFISDANACALVCEEIIKIVSDHIATLGPRPQVRGLRTVRVDRQICDIPQHLWCLMIAGNLTSGGLEKLNAFLDDKRHVGRVRCVLSCSNPSVAVQ